MHSRLATRAAMATPAAMTLGTQLTPQLPPEIAASRADRATTAEQQEVVVLRRRVAARDARIKLLEAEADYYSGWTGFARRIFRYRGPAAVPGPRSQVGSADSPHSSDDLPVHLRRGPLPCPDT